MFNDSGESLTDLTRPFLQPQNSTHRQYEALRAYFVERLPSAEAARRGGYTAACMSNGTIPAEIIDITDYGFRPDGWASLQTYVNQNGQVVPCSQNGWKSKAVVKRFTCQ